MDAATFMSMPNPSQSLTEFSGAPEADCTKRVMRRNSSRTTSATSAIVARRVRLHLHEQERAIGGDEMMIGAPHGEEDGMGVGVVAGLGGGGAEDRHGALEGAPHGGDEELLLGAEELEQVGLRHPDALSDRRDRRPVQPAYGELTGRRFDDLAAALFFGESGRGSHDASLLP